MCYATGGDQLYPVDGYRTPSSDVRNCVVRRAAVLFVGDVYTERKHSLPLSLPHLPLLLPPHMLPIHHLHLFPMPVPIRVSLVRYVVVGDQEKRVPAL
jgi:hypothetical protein